MADSQATVSGGGSTTSVAKLATGWRQQMDDELRETLKELSVTTMEADEFTARDVIGLWVPTLQGTTRRLKALVEGEELTVRTAYDPRICKQVNAYKRVT